MTTNRLTAQEVNAKPAGRHADGGGLYLQVTEWEKDGRTWTTRAWLFRYTKDGKARQMGLGSVETFSLAEARQRARQARQMLADGKDPLEERKREQDAKKIQAARTVTFKEAAERYIKAHRAGWRNAKHAEQWPSSLAAFAYPVLGELPVSEIDTALVMQVLEPNWTTRTETMSRVRGRIERVLDWARVQGMREGENPARWKAHLENLLAPKGKVARIEHHAAMDWREVPAFTAELRQREGINARALEFTILAAVRTGETIGAVWEEVDLEAKVWTIPAKRMKANQEHRVPLCDRAIEILKKLPRLEGTPYVFPGGGHGRGLGKMSMLKALQSMRPGLTVHGFRSSFRDWAGEASNHPPDVCEAALAHTRRDKSHAAYQRGDLLAKRRKLMDAWAGYCAKPAGKVLTFKKGERLKLLKTPEFSGEKVSRPFAISRD